MIAGIDIGTTGCKITVYDHLGNFVFKSYREYETQRNNNKQEIDATKLYEAVIDILKETFNKYKNIISIGITSFGESFVMLDSNDNPLLPIMVSTDYRGENECQKLIDKLSIEKIIKITGLNPKSIYSLPKIMYIKEKHPTIYSKVKRILLMEDYIIYMLTKEAIIDYTLATRTMVFDINSLSWSKEILKVAGIDENLFSKPVMSGTVKLKIKEELKRFFNLEKDVEIVPVGHDQISVVIGSGIFEEQIASDGAGTVECITPVFNENVKKEFLSKNNYALVPYILKDKYVTYAYSYTSGSLIDWFIKNCVNKLEKKDEESIFDFLEKDFKDEPTNILVLPHFSGAGTPYMDNDSKGSIVGLTLENNPSSLYQAILEGITYEMKINLEKLKEGNVNIKRLIASGGGASSNKWLQMKANILNLEIVTLKNNEAGARGSAMVAGIASGVFKDIKEANEIMVKYEKVFYPNNNLVNKYEKVFNKYKKLYYLLKELNAGD